MDKPSIGIIGLGRMGRAMAARLTAEGFDVVGWSRSGVPEGIAAAPSPADLARATDVILLALLDDRAVHEITSALARTQLAGKLIVDTSTVSPITFKSHEGEIEAAGGHLLDAPVSGGPETLLAGRAGFYIGGRPDDVLRFMPVAQALSDRIHHVGALGHGATAKLVNNMMLSGMWESLKEALLLGRKAGLDLEKMTELLSGSPAASPALKGRLPVVLGQTDDVGFPVTGVVKDLEVIGAFADHLGLPVPAMAAALASFRDAAEAGLGQADLATMVRRAVCHGNPAAGGEGNRGIRSRVTILYCTQCNWLLRAGWMAQELLQTFGDTLGEVALLPGTGGAFEIRVDGSLIWERKRDGGFPGPKELKQRVRDIIEPQRDLGHLDRVTAKTDTGTAG